MIQNNLQRKKKLKIRYYYKTYVYKRLGPKKIKTKSKQT